MTLWTLLDGGYSMPGRGTAGQRLSLWFGRLLATRHRQASIHPRAMLSPEARICPRQGRIEIGAETQIALGTLIQGNVRIGVHSSVQAYSILVGYGPPDDDRGIVRIGDYVRIAFAHGDDRGQSSLRTHRSADPRPGSRLGAHHGRR